MSEEQKLTLKQTDGITAGIARERRDLLVGLMAHPGWKIFAEEMQVQHDVRVAASKEPAGSMDGMFLKEYRLAAAWAFGAVPGLLQFAIDYYQGLVDSENNKPPVERNHDEGDD